MFPVSRIIDKKLCLPSTGSATDYCLSVSSYTQQLLEVTKMYILL